MQLLGNEEEETKERKTMKKCHCMSQIKKMTALGRFVQLKA